MTRDELREKMARAAYAHSANTFAVSWEDLNERTRAVLLREMDGALDALRDAGLALVPKVTTFDMKLAATDAMIVLVEADNAKCQQETDFQRGMASGAAMTCGSKYLDAVYRAMLSAGDLLGERGE